MESYLTSIKKRFQDYKSMGERVFAQLDNEQLFWQFNEESNSIAIIVQHLSGNMLSRWTDFLTSDGEKTWRNRDAEFESDIKTRAELLNSWNTGWECLLKALNSLQEEDLQKEVLIRNEPHEVIDAINRQLAHYPYHIGQIVFIGKMVAGTNWKSLSIPKGQSDSFNAQKFSDGDNKHA
jgi:hypothetical protein